MSSVVDYLPRTTLFRLLAVMSLVIAPHLTRLPLWASASVVAIVLCRVAIALRQWPFPPGLLKAALTIGAGVGIFLSYGRINGQQPGVALLVIMLSLKLLEMRARRDVMVVVFLMYFLLVTHFLFSQEIWTAAYLLVCMLAITTVLIDVHHPGRALPIRGLLGNAGRMLLHAAPVAALLFVLFPRVPGPLWGLPSDSGAAQTGLSDSMTPGEISNLIQSDAVAFRVEFDGQIPPPQQLYWRGPIFWVFDGRSWKPGIQSTQEADPKRISKVGGAVSYELTLEPMRRHWLLALDLPSPLSVDQERRLSADFQLVSPKPIRERLRYRAISYTQYQLNRQLTAFESRSARRLPRGFNPRTRALAERLRQQHPRDPDLIAAVLRMFREQAFYYTLRPPGLGRHSVDEFLFETRSGFCEHYASAFAVLMRAAGIPARIVTGYQGGQRNRLGDYLVVRQADAHAWTEVWLKGRGWVRVDPTAAVSPERIERGIDNALSAAEGLPDFLAQRGNWRLQWEARWDWINAQWNGWFLGYGPELQRQFLRRFGLDEIRNMVLALTVGVTTVLALVGIVSLRRSAPPPLRDPALVLWKKLGKRLRRLGMIQHPEEGPRDFAERVCDARPDLAITMQVALDAYLRLRYLQHPDAKLEQQLAGAIRQLGARSAR